MAKKVTKKVVRSEPATGAKSGRPGGRAGARSAAGRTQPADALPPPPRVTLADVFGHDRAKAILRSAIASGRLHHAWIFHGPRGVGKHTAALAFAGAILDPTTSVGLTGDLAPDPESPVQRLIAAGTHPDLHIITKELARFSEDRQVRERKLLTIPKDVIDTHLLRPAALAASVRAHGMASKVFIIDEAELLDRSVTNAPTQNAILKTLEEPPPGTVIVLVTSAEDRLLPTIRSRCQRVAFGRLSSAEMAAWARQAAIQIPPQHKDWLLRFADGSPGVLREAIDAGLGTWHERLAPLLAKVERGEYSPELGPAMATLIDEWAESHVAGSRNASKEAANHEGARLMVRLLASHFSYRLRTAGSDSERAAAAIDALVVAERELAANVRLSDLAEDLSIRMSEAMGLSSMA